MNIEQEKEIVASLSSLYPMQKFEEEAIDVVLGVIPHWIPVTEKLPEIGEYVLCMISNRYRGQFHVCQYVDKDKYRNHPYFDWWHNGFPDVVAWMPLPVPYQPQKDVTERD